MRRAYFPPTGKLGGVKKLELKGFAGVDLAHGPADCAPEHSPDALNITFGADKTPVLRPAKRHLRRYGGQIHGLFPYFSAYGADLVVHAGTSLYLDAPTPVLLYEGLQNSKSFAAQAGNLLVITDGRYALGFDGDRAAPLSEFAYIPTLRVSCPIGANSATSGTAKDKENLATPFVAEQFSPNGSNKTAHLLYKNVSDVTTYALSNGEWVPRSTDLTVNTANGTVTYETAPSGQGDCLRVVYKKPQETAVTEAFCFIPGGENCDFAVKGVFDAGSITPYFETCLTVGRRSTLSWTALSDLDTLDPVYEGDEVVGYHLYSPFFTLDGGTLSVSNGQTLAANAVEVYDPFLGIRSGVRSFTGKVRLSYTVSVPQSALDKCLVVALSPNGRLCMGQSADFPNADFLGDTENGVYFKGKPCRFGDESLPLMGYLRLGDGTQAVIKKANGASPCMYVRTFNSDGTYSVSVGAGVRGAVSEGGFCLCGNDPLFLSNDGLFALQGLKSFWGNEKYAVSRSSYIAPAFSGAEGLENAALFSDGGTVYLSLAGKTFVGRASSPEYEWSVWDIPAAAFCRVKSGLVVACGCDIFTLENGEFDSDCEGAETPVLAYLTTPLLTMGDISRRKTLVSAHVCLKSFVRSGVRAECILRSISSDAGGALAAERTGFFDFADIDFSDFTFSTDRFPQILPLKTAREFEAAQFRFRNLEGKPFGLEAFSVEYRLSSKIRR